MRLNTRIGVIAGAAVVALGSATFASAAEAKTFNLTAGAGVTNGKAHGKGTVKFVAAKRVRIQGTIDDICPKDGYGAYIEFKVNLAGGGYGTIVKRDTRKCEPKAPVRYDFAQSFPRRVVSVGVTVIEIDADTGKIGDAARKLITR